MDTWIKDELKAIDGKGLRRSLRRIETPQGGRIRLNGLEVINLCSNDYLGLAADPVLKEAAIAAITAYGCGSGSSRLVSGNNLLYEELEERVARFVRREKAIVFSTGYGANSGIIPALVDQSGIVYSDELNHASIIDGIRLSRARTGIYRHGAPDDLERLAAGDDRGVRRMIVTESVFSMNGDAAPLQALAGLAREHGIMLMVDEAHAVGVMGPEGRGLSDGLNRPEDVTAIVGTFGKALGGAGAFVAGSRDLADFIVNRARPFIFTTALPPATLASNIAALKLIESDDGPRKRLWDNIGYFTGELRASGFDTGPSCSQIIPIIIGENAATMAFCGDLLQKGVYIQGIRPPTVPQGTSRLRISLSASHCRKDLDLALDALRTAGKKFHII